MSDTPRTDECIEKIALVFVDWIQGKIGTDLVQASLLAEAQKLNFMEREHADHLAKLQAAEAALHQARAEWHEEKKRALEERERAGAAKATVAEMRAVIQKAIQWDSHDTEGVPALWLKEALKALESTIVTGWKSPEEVAKIEDDRDFYNAERIQLEQQLAEALHVLNDPEALHVHCLRTLTASQIDHLAGNRVEDIKQQLAILLATLEQRTNEANLATALAESLKKQLVEARNDSERLDWLEANGEPPTVFFDGRKRCYVFDPTGEKCSLRGTISAAMKEGGEA